MHTVNEDLMEYVLVKVIHSGKYVIIGSCYRPPNSNSFTVTVLLVRTLDNILFSVKVVPKIEYRL